MQRYKNSNIYKIQDKKKRHIGTIYRLRVTIASALCRAGRLARVLKCLGFSGFVDA